MKEKDDTIMRLDKACNAKDRTIKGLRNEKTSYANGCTWLRNQFEQQQGTNANSGDLVDKLINFGEEAVKDSVELLEEVEEEERLFTRGEAKIELERQIV